MSYCQSYTNYQRRNTNEVKVSGLTIGGKAPIRIQTMTNTSTRDIEASVEQCKRCVEVGAELVRITVPAVKDVAFLKEIKDKLHDQGFRVPLVADIHFSPQAAIESAKVADKIRINPGNYHDKKKFQHIDYTDEQYLEELEEIKKNLRPLIWLCKEKSTPIRVGVNHGSLSDRIMSRYGDTPEGMAESAMEFLRICKELEFNDLVISMKASNTRIMVYSSRLLVKKMEEEGMNFPLHLGVTEAGDSEEGRIKSAAGIGALLQDGIGETIRVSLTEDPEFEIPVARKIVDHFIALENHDTLPEITDYIINPYEYNKVPSTELLNIGSQEVPQVVISIEGHNFLEIAEKIGWQQTAEGQWICDDLSPDILISNILPASVPENKKVVIPGLLPKNVIEGVYSLLTREEFLQYPKEARVPFVQFNYSEINQQLIDKLKTQAAIILLGTNHRNGVADQRLAINILRQKGVQHPVILQRNYQVDEAELLQVTMGCDLGPLLIDGFGDGISIDYQGKITAQKLIDYAFTLLQACRVRTSKTEYISCPGCGRTLFELQETTKKIKDRTSHLKNLKIGIMGCIVNGPGEMADADYGYVGAGPGKISLYKSKTCMKKNIPQEKALDELIQLIKENGDWVD